MLLVLHIPQTAAAAWKALFVLFAVLRLACFFRVRSHIPFMCCTHARKKKNLARGWVSSLCIWMYTMGRGIPNETAKTAARRHSSSVPFATSTRALYLYNTYLSMHSSDELVFQLSGNTCEGRRQDDRWGKCFRPDAEYSRAR